MRQGTICTVHNTVYKELINWVCICLLNCIEVKKGKKERNAFHLVTLKWLPLTCVLPVTCVLPGTYSYWHYWYYTLPGDIVQACTSSTCMSQSLCTGISCFRMSQNITQWVIIKEMTRKFWHFTNDLSRIVTHNTNRLQAMNSHQQHYTTCLVLQG